MTPEEQAKVDKFIANVRKYHGQADFEKHLLEMMNSAGHLRELMHKEEWQALGQADFEKAAIFAQLRDHWQARLFVLQAMLEGIKGLS